MHWSASMHEPGDLNPTPMYRAPAGCGTRQGAAEIPERGKATQKAITHCHWCPSSSAWQNKHTDPHTRERTRTGVAVATLPTSSSACIIFLMRDGGKAAVDDLRRPMAGDPSVDTPDRAERAFTR